MTERFKKDYGAYEGVDTSIFKHIPEVSCYDNNYFVGLKREGHVGHDLLFADGNDDYQVDWYIVNGSSATYIGYEFVEEGVLNFSDTKFT